MTDVPTKEKLMWDKVARDPIDFNITDSMAQAFGSLLYLVVTVDALATGFLMVITFVTTAMDGMKLCEKVLVYNILVPDVIIELIVFIFIGPATLANKWQGGYIDSKVLAFLHTFCIFHPHLATATVCYVIAVSMNDAYRFEMANDMKHMSVVVLSTLAVSVCLCSLPATEDHGYKVLGNWLSPSFNINYQYGSLFMCVGMLGIVCYVELNSILYLGQARKFFQEHKARITERALEELEQDIVFCILSLVSASMVFPCLLGIHHAFLMFLPRVIMYLCPIMRVVTLLTTCPHFQFAFFGQQDTDEFVGLEEMAEDIAPKKQQAPTVFMEQQTGMQLNLDTEL